MSLPFIRPKEWQGRTLAQNNEEKQSNSQRSLYEELDPHEGTEDLDEEFDEESEDFEWDSLGKDNVPQQPQELKNVQKPVVVQKSDQVDSSDKELTNTINQLRELLDTANRQRDEAINAKEGAEDKEKFVRGQLKLRLKEIEDLKARMISSDNIDTHENSNGTNSDIGSKLEITKLTGEINELKKTVLSLTEEKQSMLHKYNNLQTENASMKRDDVGKKDKKDKEKKEKYKKEIAKLKKELEDAKNTNKEDLLNHDSMNDALKRITEEFNNTKAKNEEQINVLRLEKEQLSKQIIDFQLETQKGKEASNTSTVDGLKEQISALNSENNKFRVNESTLLLEKEHLIAKITAFEAEMATAKSNIKHSENELDKERKRVQQLESEKVQLISLAKMHESSESELSTKLQKEIMDLQDQLKIKNEALLKATNELSAIKEAKEALERSMEVNTQRNLLLEEEIKILKQQQNKLVSSDHELQTQLNELNNSVSRLQLKNVELETVNKQLSSDVANKSQEIKTLQQAIEEMSNEKQNSYGQQLTDSSSLYNAEKSLLNIQISSLESEKSQLQNQSGTLQQEIERLERELMNSHKELTKSQSLYEQIKEQSQQELDIEKSNLAQEKQKHQESIKQLESQLTRESNDKLTQLKGNHEKAIQDLNNEHKKELEHAQHHHKKKEEHLERTIDQLKNNQAKYQEELQTVQKSLTNLQTPLQIIREAYNVLKIQTTESRKETPTLFQYMSNTLVSALAKQSNKRFIRNLTDKDKMTLDALKKYKKEVLKNRQLYNEIQDLRGNIRVYCRVRPLSADEVNAGETYATTFPEEDTIVINNPSTGKKQSFEFERVFPPESTQESVFKDTQPLITSVLDGYNVCLFAYGQTGSGKTFTMEGAKDNPGVNYRALNELFKVTSERQDDYKVEITVSILEIYNEQIHDLLVPAQKAKTKKYEIKQGPDGMYVPDLTNVSVQTAEDVFKVIALGAKNRATSSTNMNEHSSRSHGMLIINVQSTNVVSGEKSVGKLTLVDLAGSERVDKSGVTEERLKEAQAINKSLSALGNVIAALQNKDKHIPYRDSKLTYLLQDSIGGNSKTLMFVQVSPSVNNANESVYSLLFASRVNNVELGPAKKHSESKEIAQYKNQVKRLEEALAAKGINSPILTGESPTNTPRTPSGGSKPATPKGPKKT